jgi:transmembrane sensor
LKAPAHITALYQKYINNLCNPQELQELLSYFQRSEIDHDIALLIQSELSKTESSYQSLPQVKSIIERLDQNLQLIVNPTPVKRMARLRIISYWSAAASIVLLSVVLYYTNTRLNLFTTYASVYKNDVLPGGDKAYLTLSNGEKIELDSTSKGTLASLPGIRIVKTTGGQLRYEISGDNSTAPEGYNTIATPKSGKYEVILPDGSKVFLNSASSIRFQTNFDKGVKRMVELHGEAYFEVSHRDGQPFQVRSGTQLLTVLGTHFNINAYSDEQAIKTTLFKGSVIIDYPDGKMAKLRPGQQSYINQNQLIIDQVDTVEVSDWKRGEINLKEESFKATMRKIARWYDVEVIFADNAPNDLKLGGLVSREKNLNTVLKVLELTGEVHFKVEGRRVTVMR